MNGFRLAIGRIRYKSNREPMLLDLNKTRRAGSGKLITETEGIGLRSHGSESQRSVVIGNELALESDFRDLSSDQ